MNKGDETFEMWRKPDAPVYLKVYIFNITNRDEFLSGKDSKLRFQEVGPYVYRYVGYAISKIYMHNIIIVAIEITFRVLIKVLFYIV